MGAPPLRAGWKPTSRVWLSPWVQASITDEDTRELDRLAAEKDASVGIVKRRDGRYLGRAGAKGAPDGTQVIGATAFDAGRLALERLDCE